MEGMDKRDIRQELWLELFRILGPSPHIPRTLVLHELRSFAHSFIKQAGDDHFHKKNFSESYTEKKHTDASENYWDGIQILWNNYLKKLSPRDAAILRCVAKGDTNEVISFTLKISIHTVKHLRPMLLCGFKKEVERNVP